MARNLDLSEKTVWDLLDICDEATREAQEAIDRGELGTARNLLDRVDSVIGLVRERGGLDRQRASRERASRAVRPPGLRPRPNH